jgi:hypothetical protein
LPLTECYYTQHDIKRILNKTGHVKGREIAEGEREIKRLKEGEYS